MAASSSLQQLLPRLSGIYRDPARVLRDADSLLSSDLGLHLRPSAEPLLNNDGSSVGPVLVLSGTLPMTYRGTTYNLPIDVFLPPPYPLRPPVVFVRPVSTMAIRPNHRHVGLDGQVYLPYLHEWRPNTSELTELAVWMSSTFGADPPCYAKPRDTASATNSPPPYHSEASARRRIEKEVAEANAAAEAARKAAAEEAKAKQMKQSHDAHLSNLRDVLKSTARFRIRELFDETRTELRQELIDQKLLEAGKEEILREYLAGEERKAMLLAENDKLDSAIDTLETWTELISSQKQKQVSETHDSMRKEATIDLSTIPADVHSAQMLSLSAESAAIDDCIYFLDKALVRGNIPLDVFLKEVRKLSKRQFMAKAHLMKIAQTKSFAR